jgi:predicted Na+-dependent transporter
VTIFGKIPDKFKSIDKVLYLKVVTFFLFSGLEVKRAAFSAKWKDMDGGYRHYKRY